MKKIENFKPRLAAAESSGMAFWCAELLALHGMGF